jgi:hypothetical protein
MSGSERESFFPPHIYAVTNSHVARRGFPVIRLNTIDGNIDVLKLEHGDWIPHPDGDDLAVASITLPHGKHHYFPIDLQIFVERKHLYASPYDMTIGAGDDTFMVGRFISHAGTQKNTPSLRFGSIAMLPFEKVRLGDASNFHLQEAFLVETRSISGYSGSPVFLYRPLMDEFETGSGMFEERMLDPVGKSYFLGIDCGHVPGYEKVVNRDGTPHQQGLKVGANTGMAIVIPAWRLADLLNIERFKMERQKKDEQFKKEKESEETVVLDTENESFSRESYQDALRRASRKIESGDDDE